ncbi:MAG: hypothetical protein JST86_03830 [Bacteroidetes bacterium]|nr:hypothetical protein [Bacteroidota bacterium]
MKQNVHLCTRNKSVFYSKKCLYGLCFISFIFLNNFSYSQTTYTWNVAGSGSYTTAANWTPARNAPATSDILVFNNGVADNVTNLPTETVGQIIINSSTNVTLQGTVATNVTYTVSGGTGDDLYIGTGSTLMFTSGFPSDHLDVRLLTGATGNILGNLYFSATTGTIDAADASALDFKSGSKLSLTSTYTGSIFTTSGTSNIAIFESGSLFVQQNGSDPFGLAEPAAKLVFMPGSTYSITLSANPTFSGRSFGNLTINQLDCAPCNYTGPSPLTIDGDLNITNETVNFNLIGGINIKGNVSIDPSSFLGFNLPSAGQVSFNGTTHQTISDVAPFSANSKITFNNNADVYVNNVNGITIGSTAIDPTVTINRSLTFTSGIVSLSGSTILGFSAGASTASASNISFVDGPVLKTGNVSFSFPIGKTTSGPSGSIYGYAPLTIINFTGGTATDQYQAEYKRGSALTLGPVTPALGLDHVSLCDYWTLSRVTGSSTVDITLAWDDPINNCVTTSPYVNYLPSLTVARNSAGAWNAYGVAGVTTGTITTGTVTWSGVQSTSFGAFAIGSIDFNNPLSLTLNYLNGTKQSNGNYLYWKVTCTNNPTATMTLERSMDGSSFTAITSITADALRCQQPFDYTDLHPLAGTNYYRLKMTDANNKVTYSAAIAIINKDAGFELVNMIPSVVQSSAVLNVAAAQKTKMTVVITDIAGRRVEKLDVNLVAGSNRVKLNLAGLAAGSYQITGYTAEGDVRTLRFVKQ